MTREETIHELDEWLKQMIQHDVPSHSAKRKALATAIALLSAEAADVYKAHEEEHLNIINRIKELQYAIAKTQTIVGKMVESAEAEQVTGKLKKHCDSLLKSDSDECKEQKSKLDLIRREDAINAIDDAIDTDSPQWAILRTKIGFLPSAGNSNVKTQNSNGDLIYRADSIEAIMSEPMNEPKYPIWFADKIKALPSAEDYFTDGNKIAEWIPCSERLPEDGQGVLVTVDANKWNIEVGSCIYSGGTFHSKLYDLDVLAWMPLPEPWKGADDE